MNHLLFKSAYLFYSASTGLYLAYLFWKKEFLSRTAFLVLIGALALHAGSLVSRTLAARGSYNAQAQELRLEGHVAQAQAVEKTAHNYVPWNDWFESFSFFGAIVAFIYLLIAWSTPIPVLGSFVMLASWGLMTGALIKSSRIGAATPVVQNPWLAIHVPVMFTSYALLTVAFAVAVAFLIEERQLKTKRPTEISFRLPPLQELDEMISKLILIAVPLLTCGILLGGIWAHQVWGRYWNWDAKETWALITWLIYVGYLLLRFVVGWRGRKTAYLSLVGFGVAMFTYVGVNSFSPLHGFLTGMAR